VRIGSHRPDREASRPPHRTKVRSVRELYLARSRCTWHARHVQRQRPTQRGILAGPHEAYAVDQVVYSGSATKVTQHRFSPGSSRAWSRSGAMESTNPLSRE
jgi:hypothetical protein